MEKPKLSLRIASLIVDMHVNRRMGGYLHYLAKAGCGYLGSGSSRVVYRCGEFVVKLETGHGIHANSDNFAEWEYYHNSDNAIREHLAVPYFISPNNAVLIMEYVPKRMSDIISDCDDDDARYDLVLEVMSFFEKLRERDQYSTNDAHSQNMGVRSDGSYAIFDYAAATKRTDILMTVTDMLESANEFG